MGERKEHIYDTQRKDPRSAWGAVALDCCGYVLLKHGHEEQISRGLQEQEYRALRPVKISHERDDEPEWRAGLRQAVAELLIATYNTAHDGTV